MKRRTVLEYLKERGDLMGERICPYCGAHLDPEERCDCLQARAEYENSTHDTLASTGAI